MSLTIASWNVNSIKAREAHVEKYLKQSNLDILMMQELKGVEFPADTFEALGYSCIVKSQKAYNGVAVLYKKGITLDLVSDALYGFEDDEQARFIEVKSGQTHIINIYMPNGNPVESEKFPYKLKWMGHLYDRLKTLRASNTPFLIGGDFNIIPRDEDCHDPKAWSGDALFRPESLKLFRQYLNLGLSDAYRIFDTSAETYSFWDYQRGAWQKNDGIRIDHFLTSPEITDRLTGCIIDKEPRGWEKPSDHTPIIVELASLI